MELDEPPEPADSLGWASVAEGVAAFLTDEHTRTPFTLAIEGELGSGTTAFMNLLEHELRREQEVVLWFTGWDRARGEPLLASFAVAFNEQVIRTLSPWRRWRGHSTLLRRRYRWRHALPGILKAGLQALALVWLVAVILTVAFTTGWSGLIEFYGGLLPGGLAEVLSPGFVAASGALATIGLSALLLLQVTRLVGNPLELDLRKYERGGGEGGKLGFLERFEREFIEHLTAYVGADEATRMYVFLPDLNQVELDDAISLMTTLRRMMAQDPRLVFVVSLDASQALEDQDTEPVTDSEGPEATSARVRGSLRDLDRLINVRLPLPPLPASFTNHTLNSYTRTSPPTGEETTPEEVTYALAPFLELNPRRVRSFIDTLRLLTSVAERGGRLSSGRDGGPSLTVPMLGKLVVIRMHWPLLLVRARESRGLLGRLERACLQRVARDALPSSEARWLESPVLEDLLGFGLGGPEAGGSPWSLAEVDLAEVVV